MKEVIKVLVERNDLCPCGSQKKYKKCCLGKSKEELFEERYARFIPFLSQITNREKIPMEVYKRCPFVNGFNHRSSVLRGVHLAKEFSEFSELEEIELDSAIQQEIAYAFKHTYLGLEGFKKRMSTARILPLPDFTITFSEQETKFLLAVSEQILDEYPALDTGKQPNRPLIKVMLQFIYHVMVNNIQLEKDERFLLTVDSKYKSIKWRKIKSYGEYLQFQFEDNLSKEYHELHSTYPGLLPSSIHTMLSIDYHESNLPSHSRSLLSFAGLSMNYFGIIESELKEIVKEDTQMQDKKIMWRHLSQKLKETQYFGSKTINESVINLLDRYNGFRNKAAHGEFIHLEEYMELKTTIEKSNIFKEISNLRLYNESLESLKRLILNLKKKSAHWEFFEKINELKLKVPVEQVLNELDTEDLDVNFALALIYGNVQVNLKKSIELLHYGAERRHVNSQLMLGDTYNYKFEEYFDGPDIPKANYWYEQAAYQGNACAMHELSMNHGYKGEGYEWLKKAAQLGYMDAVSDLESIDG